MKRPQYGGNESLSKIIVIYNLFQQSGDNLIWIQTVSNLHCNMLH